ncbi:MAG TPA: agmatine deiminase family protein, partial [Thermoanaerobaculia bacterium]
MTASLKTSPAADGFRMPGEFEPHSGCWMAWPERPDNWRLGGKPAQEAWVQVIEAIASGDAVTVLTSYGQWPNARARLPQDVRVLETTTNDAWV